ncbi:MAG: nucleotide-binding domain containing protein, partial [Geminicoccaceae bacterium]|nr:nucleotide-binding domain containing protein [Geminicoccaceae bacterium]
LPENFRAAGLLAAGLEADALPGVDGHEAVLAGSCSKATLEQIERFEARHPGYAIDPLALARGEGEVERALVFAEEHLGRPFLISSSRPPEEVERVQAELGRERAGTLVEDAMAQIARQLVARGVRRLVVAGGETSGAVVGALGIEALRIGPPIDPGVPWTLGSGETELLLALKSGNFGAPDFFTKAFEALR